MSIFRELTEGLPRQAPGSAGTTLRALGLARGLPTRPRILDVGCGPGAQTIELARATGGWIVAVDIRQRFLDELTERAGAAGVLPQITTVNTSMFDMDFAGASFDLIWSEGAIYIAGFAAGLARVAAVPEAGRMDRGIRTDVAGAGSAGRGRRISGRGTIPPWDRSSATARSSRKRATSTWTASCFPMNDWHNYYGPGERRVEELQRKVRRRYRGARDARRCAARVRSLPRHHDAYGYVFYVMRKPTA